MGAPTRAARWGEKTPHPSRKARHPPKGEGKLYAVGVEFADGGYSLWKMGLV